MQRRRLLLAVAEVLAEQGLEGATIGSICKRAGVSRRTFYETFGDRDECLLAVFDAVVERLSRPVLAAWQAEGKWNERLRGALEALLKCFDAEPDIARLCIVEMLKAGPVVAAHRASTVSALVSAVEQGRAESLRSGAPPPLAGQGVVGGALSVLYAHLVDVAPGAPDPVLSELSGALMAMIVHPYLGPAAARRELNRYALQTGAPPSVARDPFKGLSIRFTYRTAMVLATIAADPGASNRLIAEAAGVADEGQMSRLLSRLQRAGLIENRGKQNNGEANAWLLTDRGEAVHATLAGLEVGLAPPR